MAASGLNLQSAVSLSVVFYLHYKNEFYGLW